MIQILVILEEVDAIESRDTSLASDGNGISMGLMGLGVRVHPQTPRTKGTLRTQVLQGYPFTLH